MIEVRITDEMIQLATDKSIEMGKLNNSILKGRGNIAGFIGEQIAIQALKGVWQNTYDYDITVGDVKVDVKTKQTTVKPLPHYECSVANYNTKQNCDAYAFVRVLKDQSVGWYLGSLNKKEYYDKATYIKKGDFDPSNNWTAHADCYNVRIDELERYVA